jgi:hypothetical protein
MSFLVAASSAGGRRRPPAVPPVPELPTPRQSGIWLNATEVAGKPSVNDKPGNLPTVVNTIRRRIGNLTYRNPRELSPAPTTENMELMTLGVEGTDIWGFNWPYSSNVNVNVNVAQAPFTNNNTNGPSRGLLPCALRWLRHGNEPGLGSGVPESYFRDQVANAIAITMIDFPANNPDRLYSTAVVRFLGTFAMAADMINLAGYNWPGLSDKYDGDYHNAGWTGTGNLDAAFRIYLHDMVRAPMAFKSYSNADPPAVTTRDTECIYDPTGVIHYEDGWRTYGISERQPTNIGNAARASRLAVAMYLGDATEINRCKVLVEAYCGVANGYGADMRPMLGGANINGNGTTDGNENHPYGAGYTYRGHNKDVSWAHDAASPVPINPAGATKSGRNIDGVLVCENRRNGTDANSFGEWLTPWPNQPSSPTLGHDKWWYKTNGPSYNSSGLAYPWEALEYLGASLWMLWRLGYDDPFQWGDQAFRRAVAWLYTWAVASNGTASGPSTAGTWEGAFRGSGGYPNETPTHSASNSATGPTSNANRAWVVVLCNYMYESGFLHSVTNSGDWNKASYDYVGPPGVPSDGPPTKMTGWLQYLIGPNGA